MTVGTKLASARTLNILGGTLVCVGYIISSRAEDIRLLLLSYGVIQGKIKTHDLKLHMFKISYTKYFQMSTPICQL